MPYGKRVDAAGRSIDFDEIYDQMIKPAVEAVGVRCFRGDEEAVAGWIHRRMFEHINSADVAVVDISSLNPNVFYELGIRHALAKSVTVLIRSTQTEIPFNVQGMTVIEYETTNLTSVAEAKQKIGAVIANGLKSTDSDSPVHDVLELRTEDRPTLLTRTQVIDYPLVEVPSKSVGVITGDIRAVKWIDIWVNSENVNMQMARHFDNGISAIIRYLGAKKHPQTEQILEDSVANELGAVMGAATSVSPGTVIDTTAGELERTHNVKRIFHAAAVQGQLGVGYEPIPDLGFCVRTCLDRMTTAGGDGGSFATILFPLMGTGTGRGATEAACQVQIEAAISWLIANADSSAERVYFLARKQEHLLECERLLDSSADTSQRRRGRTS